MKILKVRVNKLRLGVWYKMGQEYEVEEYNEDYYRRSGMDDFILKADCERIDDDPIIECQKCFWRGSYNDLISPTSDHEPGCPKCLSTDMLEVEDDLFETMARMTKAQVQDQSDPFTRMKRMLDEGIASLMGILEILDKMKEENDDNCND